ncbi:MAG: hypothetical protein ACI82A_002446 [Candidatus Azotimanducaceae bacterium]|jgi:hypothetical protein
MKPESNKPIILFIVTGVVLGFSILQSAYFAYMLFWLPKNFSLELADLVWLSLKFLAGFYLVGASWLLLISQRIGVYLVELAVLFSLVSFFVLTLYSWYNIYQFMDVQHPLPWIIQIVLAIGIVSAHVFYLWCLRNEKAILYFKLNDARAY